MTPEMILAIVGQSFAMYQQIRAAAKANGITDEQLDAITADYDARIARRDAEINQPPPSGLGPGLEG